MSGGESFSTDICSAGGASLLLHSAGGESLPLHYLPYLDRRLQGEYGREAGQLSSNRMKPEDELRDNA